MSAQFASGGSRLPRFAESAVQRARLRVVPRGAQQAPRAPFAALVAVMLVAGVVGLLMFNTSMQARAFEQTELQDKLERIEAREQKLSLELDRLRDPQHLATRARAMGMVPAGEPAFMSITDGSVTGAPAPAPGTDFRFTPRPELKPQELAPDPIIVRKPPRNADAGSGSGSNGDQRGQANSKPKSKKSTDSESTGRTQATSTRE